MIRIGDETEPQFVVPQNSVMNMRQKLGLVEPNCTAVQSPTQPRPPSPFTNTQNASARAATKCPHCENMAKNFLYLESLIRTNFNAKDQCSLCYSSLKYLQYINKSITQVFGDINPFTHTAMTTLQKPQKSFAKLNKPNARVGKGRISPKRTRVVTNEGKDQKGPMKKDGSKHGLPKKKSTLVGKLIPSASKHSPKNKPKPKQPRAGSKISLDTTKKNMRLGGHPVRKAEGAFENGSKVIRGSKKPSPKVKAKIAVGGVKQRNKRIKRNKKFV